MLDFFQHASPMLALTLAVIAFAIVGGFVLDLLAATLAALIAIRRGRSNPRHRLANEHLPQDASLHTAP